MFLCAIFRILGVETDEDNKLLLRHDNNIIKMVNLLTETNQTHQVKSEKISYLVVPKSLLRNAENSASKSSIRFRPVE